MPGSPTSDAAAGRGRRRRRPTASQLRTLRILVARLVVAALISSVLVASALSGCMSAGRGVVPPDLVGAWRGEAAPDRSPGNGSWCYEFASDGRYRAWPESAPSAVNAGTVVVDHTTIWFSNGGAPVSSTWSLSDGVLLLDGKRFVRAPEKR